MRKINKAYYVVLIFTLVGVFLCQNLAYAINTAYLRVPVGDHKRIEKLARLNQNQPDQTLASEYLRVGIATFKLGDVEEARRMFLEAIKRIPRDYRPREKVFLMIIEVDGKNNTAWVRLAVRLHQQEKLNKKTYHNLLTAIAEKDFRKARRLAGFTLTSIGSLAGPDQTLVELTQAELVEKIGVSDKRISIIDGVNVGSSPLEIRNIALNRYFAKDPAGYMKTKKYLKRLYKKMMKRKSKEVQLLLKDLFPAIIVDEDVFGIMAGSLNKGHESEKMVETSIDDMIKLIESTVNGEIKGSLLERANRTDQILRGYLKRLLGESIHGKDYEYRTITDNALLVSQSYLTSLSAIAAYDNGVKKVILPSYNNVGIYTLAHEGLHMNGLLYLGTYLDEGIVHYLTLDALLQNSRNNYKKYYSACTPMERGAIALTASIVEDVGIEKVVHAYFLGEYWEMGVLPVKLMLAELKRIHGNTKIIYEGHGRFTVSELIKKLEKERPSFNASRRGKFIGIRRDNDGNIESIYDYNKKGPRGIDNIIRSIEKNRKTGIFDTQRVAATSSRDPFLMQPALMQVVASYKDKINIVVDVGEDIIIVGDEDSFKKILDELIDNSIYHGEAKNIDITVRHEDNKLELIVKDDGKGLPEEALVKDENGIEEVFKTDYTTQKPGGSGLFFVHETITAWGDDISVTSEPGKGTILTITFLPGATIEDKELIRQVKGSRYKTYVVADQLFSTLDVKDGIGKAIPLRRNSENTVHATESLRIATNLGLPGASMLQELYQEGDVIFLKASFIIEPTSGLPVSLDPEAKSLTEEQVVRMPVWHERLHIEMSRLDPNLRKDILDIIPKLNGGIISHVKKTVEEDGFKSGTMDHSGETLVYILTTFPNAEQAIIAHTKAIKSFIKKAFPSELSKVVMRIWTEARPSEAEVKEIIKAAKKISPYIDDLTYASVASDFLEYAIKTSVKVRQRLIAKKELSQRL